MVVQSLMHTRCSMKCLKEIHSCNWATEEQTILRRMESPFCGHSSAKKDSPAPSQPQGPVREESAYKTDSDIEIWVEDPLTPVIIVIDSDEDEEPIQQPSMDTVEDDPEEDDIEPMEDDLSADVEFDPSQYRERRDTKDGRMP